MMIDVYEYRADGLCVRGCDSIAYQIFPDRFAPHPNPEQHGLQFAPWGSTPTLRDFQVWKALAREACTLRPKRSLQRQTRTF